MTLRLDSSGVPTFVLRDEAERPRIGMGVFAAGPDISILDADGRVIWSALRLPDRRPPAVMPSRWGRSGPTHIAADGST